MNIWTKLGISVAMVAMFCIVMLEAFQNKSYYDAYKWHICAVFLSSGLVVYFVGRSINRARKARYLEQKNSEEAQPSSDEEEETPEDGEPFILVNMAYWGVMLMTFGTIIIFIVPTYKKPEPVMAREPKKTNAPVLLTNAVLGITNQPAAPAKPPTLKLQGLVFRKPNPSVLINGRTYFIGDLFEDAELIEIGPKSAVFRWKDERIVLQAPD